MTRPLLSNHWHRVCGLRPRLRGHVRIHRHEYRGQVWHVFEDRIGGRHHRFNAAAWRVIQLLDGRRDLATLWALLTQTVDDETPTQDDIIQLLGQLHSADLVYADVTPDNVELLERGRKHARAKWIGRLANPIALRFPLYDPDALLTRLARWLRPLDGWTGIGLWLVVVLPALLLLPSQWAGLTGNAQEQWLAADNLLMLALLFPLVKVLHELGHGLVCKWRGGEVHECGVMLLAFYPVPFVDVSNAAALGSKWQRALVGAAGMLVELFIAAIAFYLWLLLEPGLLRSIAYNVAVLASVTTVFFNANPLLRFDGYYILADLAELPNLGARANRHWQDLVERRVFGVQGGEPPRAGADERRWFLAYAPLAYVYRLVVAIGIAIFIAQKLFFVGVALALWSIGQSLVWPVFKGLRALATAPRFAGHGTRIRAVLAGGAAGAALLLFVVPLPMHTVTEGVLWLPERALLRAGTAGFVRQVLAAPGTQVQPGQAVIESVEPALVARIGAQRGRLEEIQAQLDAAWTVSQARVQQLEQDVAREQAALARLEDEAQQLTLRASVAGALLVDRPDDLPGRYVKKGEVLGYLRTADPPLVRVLVPQGDVDTIQLSTRAVEARMAQAPERSWPARLARQVPAATRQLPSAVLAVAGGGTVQTDPRDAKSLATVESMFEFELELPHEVPHDFLGSRVHVRFEHAPEPVGLRGWRALRRAFLSHFNV
ncbi:PqqD family peptide modification chaperone [Ramlibacter montanisoli]|uniref:PqqD family peptide modification chaperone n=1 Tax=Ramlibacter montanisoli TaxID=2732512 RepID=UPI001C0EE60B|nr:PqqD family peptide modification chaperone [Ramlibacter montanisoli]